MSRPPPKPLSAPGGAFPARSPGPGRLGLAPTARRHCRAAGGRPARTATAECRVRRRGRARFLCPREEHEGCSDARLRPFVGRTRSSPQSCHHPLARRRGGGYRAAPGSRSSGHTPLVYRPVGLAEQALAAGLYFSINPAMLRTEKGRKVIAAVPRDRVLTESDCASGRRPARSSTPARRAAAGVPGRPGRQARRPRPVLNAVVLWNTATSRPLSACSTSRGSQGHLGGQLCPARRRYCSRRAVGDRHRERSLATARLILERMLLTRGGGSLVPC